MVIPDQTDSVGKVRHLAVGAGKDGNLYLVNRDSMGKFSSSNNNVYQELAGALPGGVWAVPAYFSGTIYYGPVGSPIYAFQFTNAKLSTAPVAQTSSSFGYPGAIPSISADNNTNGIVWAVENTNPAILHAYDATNLNELYNSNQAAGSRDHFGAGNKFIAPTIANGRVYVGTTSGVGVFGLLHLSVSPPTSLIACAVNIEGAGVCDIAVVQRVINSALGLPCVTGPGVTAHAVSLSWMATDSTVQPGQTYYYVATAVDSSGDKSAYSAPAVQSVVPSS
jgi:hypothetical protein